MTLTVATKISLTSIYNCRTSVLEESRAFIAGSPTWFLLDIPHGPCIFPLLVWLPSA